LIVIYNRFIAGINSHFYVNRIILALILCVIFFVLPLQVYIIGNDNGFGIQGATYRIQISGYGNSLIPITSDLMYIFNGIYSGRTALSIIVWVLGTILLACTTLFGLIFASDNRPDFFRQIGMGLLASGACYIISCMAQYGWFFVGAAGISMPVGILLIVLWIIVISHFPDFFIDSKTQQ